MEKINLGVDYIPYVFINGKILINEDYKEDYKKNKSIKK